MGTLSNSSEAMFIVKLKQNEFFLITLQPGEVTKPKAKGSRLLGELLGRAIADYAGGDQIAGGCGQPACVQPAPQSQPVCNACASNHVLQPIPVPAVGAYAAGNAYNGTTVLTADIIH